MQWNDMQDPVTYYAIKPKFETTFLSRFIHLGVVNPQWIHNETSMKPQSFLLYRNEGKTQALPIDTIFLLVVLGTSPILDSIVRRASRLFLMPHVKSEQGLNSRTRFPLLVNWNETLETQIRHSLGLYPTMSMIMSTHNVYKMNYYKCNGHEIIIIQELDSNIQELGLKSSKLHI